MEFDDDKVHHTHQVAAVIDLKRRVRREIKDYTPRYLLKEQKIHFDVLDYWRKNKDIYPCLFKAAEACLHVPATSIPAERIFTLTGYAVRDRRTKHVSDNMKLIFLDENDQLIPDQTPAVTKK